MKKRFNSFVVCGILSIAFVGCKKESTTPAVNVLTNGIYMSEKIEDYNCYLRFYDDKTVIGVTSTGTPAQISSWFTKDGKDMNAGMYSMENDSIFFTLTNSYGSVDYSGLIHAGDTVLTMQTFSHINGNKSNHQFSFCKLQ